MKLSVVIVNYNVKYYVEQCLKSLQRSLATVDAEVFVMDNHSRDGSVDYLSSRFPWVKVVRLNHNLGFAKANNKAITMSHGEYVLLLNPDTLLSETLIPRVLSFMDAHPHVGASGVWMMDAELNAFFISKCEREPPWSADTDDLFLQAFWPLLLFPSSSPHWQILYVCPSLGPSRADRDRQWCFLSASPQGVGGCRSFG